MININKIPIPYVDEAEMDSLRGPYVLVKNFKHFFFTVKDLEKELDKGENTGRFFELVEEEMFIYENKGIDELKAHPFWKGDEDYLAEGYLDLHKDFIAKMKKSKYATSRNTVAANPNTCLTLLQRHNKTLYAVSRSCDISLGFLADLYTLYLYAKRYKLEIIEGFITTPHIYVNNLNKTIEQFESKTKIRNLIFNKRGK